MSDIGGPAEPRGVNGFVLNLIVPGLGHLYCGNLQQGAKQLGVFLLGLLLLSWMTILGGLVIAGAWVWSALTGFQLLARST